MARQAPDSLKPRILQTYIDLVQRSGYEAVGMRDIAADLHIKAPSIYHHFGSKEQLATAAMENYRLAQAQQLRLLDDRESHAARLQGYIGLFAEMLADESRLCLCLIMLRERHTLAPDTVAEAQRFVRQNVEWLERTIDECDAQPGGPCRGSLADIVFGAFEGLMLVSSIEESPDKHFRSRANDLLTSMGLL